MFISCNSIVAHTDSDSGGILSGDCTSLEQLEIQPRGAEALGMDIGEGGASLEETSEYHVPPCISIWFLTILMARKYTQVLAQAWNSWRADLTEQKLLRDQARWDEMANRLQQASEEITVNQMSAVRAAERCHDLERDLERSLQDQESSIVKLKGRIEELESLLTRGPDQHTEEYRKQVTRIEELEALLRKLETERLAEVQKLRDEITRLTGLLDEMRSMQSQSQFEVQKFRDEIMRLNRLLDEMRNMQSQPPVRAEPVTTLQHTRISPFARPGPSHLLETAMADASSGFRLIRPSPRN
jgi:hypothetical protein